MAELVQTVNGREASPQCDFRVVNCKSLEKLSLITHYWGTTMVIFALSTLLANLIAFSKQGWAHSIMFRPCRTLSESEAKINVCFVFRLFWSFHVRAQNHLKMTKNAIFRKICNIPKIIEFDSEVEYTFPGRFWKAEGPYFTKIEFASTKSQF